MMKPLIKALLVMLTSVTVSLQVAADDFAIEPGDIYTGDHSTNTIIQVNPGRDDRGASRCNELRLRHRYRVGSGSHDGDRESYTRCSTIRRGSH